MSRDFLNPCPNDIITMVIHLISTAAKVFFLMRVGGSVARLPATSGFQHECHGFKSHSGTLFFSFFARPFFVDELLASKSHNFNRNNVVGI